MEVPNAKFLSTSYGGDGNDLNRRNLPIASSRLGFPHIHRQQSRSAPGSRRSSPSSTDRYKGLNKADMDHLQVAFQRGFYRGSPRSSERSNRSNRLPRSGDLGIISPYAPPHKTFSSPYDSDESIFRSGKHGLHAQYPAGRYDWDSGKPPKEPKTFKGVLNRFGTHTSLQGIPFILRAKRSFSKFLWTFLFIAAMGLTTWQFYEVIKKYLAKDTSSSIKLGYANLEFPSVTLCNLNPIRKSALDETSDALRAFLDSLAPPDDYDQGGPGFGELRPRRPRGPQSNNGGLPPPTPQPAGTPQPTVRPGGVQPGGTQQPTQQPAGTPQPTARPGGVQPGGTQQPAQQPAGTPQPTARPGGAQQPTARPGGAQQPTARPGGAQQPTARPGGQNPPPGPPTGRRKRQTDQNSEVEVDDVDFDRHRPPPGGDDFGRGNASAKFVYKEVFYNLVADLGRDTREDVGHQRNVFLLDCEFNGRQCHNKHWQESLSREYGNCYTFNNIENQMRSLRSQRAGSQYGLNLILYVEQHEYLRGIVGGLGARFAIHPYKTLPFVAENGLSVATGTETFVGMKKIDIERIGICGDNGEFEGEYGKKYTVEACVSTCLDRVHIVRDCQCYRPEYYNFYSPKTIKTLRPCSTAKDLKCIYKLKQQDAMGNIKCRCKEECTGITYDITPSYNHWPDTSLWFSLVDAVCAQSESSCKYLKNVVDEKRRQILKDNFIALRIYYRDLNFETIKEEPVYEDSQFVADLGGTAGLWVGASVLTVMEVIDLLIQICMFPCKRRRNVNDRRPPVQHQNYHSRM